MRTDDLGPSGQTITHVRISLSVVLLLLVTCNREKWHSAQELHTHTLGQGTGTVEEDLEACGEIMGPVIAICLLVEPANQQQWVQTALVPLLTFRAQWLSFISAFHMLCRFVLWPTEDETIHGGKF